MLVVMFTSLRATIFHPVNHFLDSYFVAILGFKALEFERGEERLPILPRVNAKLRTLSHREHPTGAGFADVVFFLLVVDALAEATAARNGFRPDG